MSMFSIHYVIRSKDGYWAGGTPSFPASWVPASSGYAIRFFTKRDADAVVHGVLGAIACAIEEDE